MMSGVVKLDRTTMIIGSVAIRLFNQHSNNCGTAMVRLVYHYLVHASGLVKAKTERMGRKRILSMFL